MDQESPLPLCSINPDLPKDREAYGQLLFTHIQKWKGDDPASKAIREEFNNDFLAWSSYELAKYRATT